MGDRYREGQGVKPGGAQPSRRTHVPFATKLPKEVGELVSGAHYWKPIWIFLKLQEAVTTGEYEFFYAATGVLLSAH
eukprot:12892068-Prorocentrum_lima.AAC.1